MFFINGLIITKILIAIDAESNIGQKDFEEKFIKA